MIKTFILSNQILNLVDLLYILQNYSVKKLHISGRKIVQCPRGRIESAEGRTTNTMDLEAVDLHKMSTD